MLLVLDFRQYNYQNDVFCYEYNYLNIKIKTRMYMLAKIKLMKISHYKEGIHDFMCMQFFFADSTCKHYFEHDST